MIWIDLLKILMAVGVYVAVLAGGIWVVRLMGRRDREPRETRDG